MAWGRVSPSVPILIVLPTRPGYFVANLSGSHFASAAKPADGRKSSIASNAATTDNARYFAMTLTFRYYLSLQRDGPQVRGARALPTIAADARGANARRCRGRCRTTRGHACARIQET